MSVTQTLKEVKKEDEVDESESDLDVDELKTEIKRNKEGEDKLRGAYGNG